jgi:hypothetical protein
MRTRMLRKGSFKLRFIVFSSLFVVCRHPN